jgi:hypothetical protein
MAGRSGGVVVSILGVTYSCAGGWGGGEVDGVRAGVIVRIELDDK